MTHVLVVHRDEDVADLEVDELRRSGYEVSLCTGPAAGPCPLLMDRTCWMADAADVLVCDVRSSADEGRELITWFRERYPVTPVILTAAAPLFDWVSQAGPYGVTTLVGAPGPGDLLRLVQAVTAAPEPAATRA
jgi:DNA-binding NtrC family response regulator